MSKEILDEIKNNASNRLFGVSFNDLINYFQDESSVDAVVEEIVNECTNQMQKDIKELRRKLFHLNASIDNVWHNGKTNESVNLVCKQQQKVKSLLEKTKHYEDAKPI